MITAHKPKKNMTKLDLSLTFSPKHRSTNKYDPRSPPGSALKSPHLSPKTDRSCNEWSPIQKVKILNTALSKFECPISKKALNSPKRNHFEGNSEASTQKSFENSSSCDCKHLAIIEEANDLITNLRLTISKLKKEIREKDEKICYLEKFLKENENQFNKLLVNQEICSEKNEKNKDETIKALENKLKLQEKEITSRYAKEKKIFELQMLSLEEDMNEKLTNDTQTKLEIAFLKSQISKIQDIHTQLTKENDDLRNQIKEIRMEEITKYSFQIASELSQLSSFINWFQSKGEVSLAAILLACQVHVESNQSPDSVVKSLENAVKEISTIREFLSNYHIEKTRGL
ncbi:unnamed protein product [Blepharisma stoltei]|uniref:Uncharacterized protein n=1 Tax=Blepharisma stoltei TaxID=1481888 RepID=A0AAU9IY19_9CILI|nr:unnamed protein product [Blepharisma stoltei]